MEVNIVKYVVSVNAGS